MLCYQTQYGQSFCGDSRDLINTLKDESVDLVITSPPYPLINPKEYGNESHEKYENWLIEFIELIIPKIKDTGSIVLDFGTSYIKGEPCYNIYAFRLLVHFIDKLDLKLCQPFYWYNPSRLPMPTVYVNRRKIRAKDNVNNLWWLSKTAFPKADTTKVLKPYSKSMRKMFRKKRLKNTTWKKNEGALPSNLLQISNTNNKSQYLKACRIVGVKPHPARFPNALPEFFVKMLTDEGDLVVDIFAGSNVTGFTCEQLGRNWISFEQSKEYVASGALRFISDINNSQKCYDAIMNNDLPTDILQF